MLGKRVESARTSLGWKQHELAEKIGVSQQAIQKIEDGRTKMPRDINKLAKVLDVSVEWLITGNSPQPATKTPEDKKIIELAVNLMSFLTAEQQKDAFDFIERLKIQNEKVFEELGAKMMTKKRNEQLYINNNRAHA